MRNLPHPQAPWRATALALTLVAVMAGPAQARLYAVSGAGGAPSTLYELDPADGSVVATIGATGLNHVTSIACHPQTGVMYAVSNNPDQLLTIDTSTGLATVVGPTAMQIPDIAFDSAGTLYAWTESSDDLVTIDLLTGAASLVGECGCGTARTGLAFDSADDLYMSNGSSLNLMDAASGTITSSVPLSASTQNMLAFDATDTLYGGQRGGGSFTLVTIDPATGSVTAVGSNPIDSISALAFCTDAPLDHFMFYKRKANPAGPKFYGFGPVTLADQFGSRTFSVVKPSGLGLPADKNGEGIADPTTHLEEYRLGKPDPVFAPTAARIVNQCNDVQVQVVKPFSLLVPTSKDLVAPVPPPPPGSHNVDHFLCYKVKTQTPLPKGFQVDVADQFQTRRYDLKKLVKLCNPVAKSGAPILSAGPNKGDPKTIAPAVIENAVDHLACYKAKLAKKLIAQTGCGPTTPGDKGTPLAPQAPHTRIVGVHTNNQFGAEQHDTVKESEICIPSYKDPVCGDGLVNQGSEQCDGAADAACAGLPCLGDCTCTPPTCGDDLVNQGSEQCDGAADAACPGDCLANCLCAVCGDNVAEAPAEACDGTDDAACPGLCSSGCQCGVLSPASEDLTTCAPSVSDSWEFTVAAGQNIVATADTVDAGTAADLCLSVSCPGGLFFSADDNMACTFPPPSFACPNAAAVATAGGTCALNVGICSSACADPGTANYSLRVTLDGADTIVSLTGDDL